jgi:predicted ATP-binding protein involved in virulence
METLDILIIAPSGYGKSNLADIVKNSIFKADINAHIHVDDKDRELKELGDGKNKYNIIVRREKFDEDIAKADIIVEIKSKKFYERYHEIN